MPRTLSIIIPTLDEAAELGRVLPLALAAADEVIVSDGGSGDGSVRLARRLGAKVVEGAAGRGPQLNRGARASTGEALIFLHADTDLPPDAASAVRAALDAGCVGGGFRLRFDVAGKALRFGERLIDLRTRWTRAPLGDQAQFADRRAFEEIDGFRDWPILEDLDFIRRLGRHGRLALLDGPVTTSSRRFRERGWPRTVALNWTIWGLWALGVSPHRLARLYRKVR